MATRWESPAPDRSAHQQVGSDRRDTDESLRAEREKTDELLELERVEQRVGDVLEQQRAEAEERLQHVRDEVDSHLNRQAEVLPQISDTLEDVSESLTQAAASLTESADTLRAPEVVPGSGELIGRMAEIAGTIAEVTDDLDVERQRADEKLRREREVTDHIIDQQLTQTGTVVTEQVRDEQRLLVHERLATDNDLAEERQHTDQAIDHVLELLVDEQMAHTMVQQEFATRNEFLTIVSHDLRGPIATIDTTAKFIIAAAPAGAAGEMVRDGAERIRRSAAIMNRLIRDLLDFACLQDGTLRVVAKRQDVRVLVTGSIGVFLPLAKAKAITLEAQIPENPVMAVYDFDRMMQVMSNLIENGIKFTPEGGRIRVRVAPAGRECLVAVADTGIGIAKDELTSIFERFRQLGGERGGLGLGLYISKWIVEAHRGRIWADSRPGSGSTFYFTLPAE
jgi:signal transduction histidine kinase